ncbi:hypothetical protein C8R45DRAFT_173829 [Mycena sanguinolenta]|nr:hypothetical protein C8R45DRAFT_173829 [Mycena sanguinolenta]
MLSALVRARSTADEGRRRTKKGGRMERGQDCGASDTIPREEWGASSLLPHSLRRRTFCASRQHHVNATLSHSTLLCFASLVHASRVGARCEDATQLGGRVVVHFGACAALSPIDAEASIGQHVSRPHAHPYPSSSSPRSNRRHRCADRPNPQEWCVQICNLCIPAVAASHPRRIPSWTTQAGRSGDSGARHAAVRRRIRSFYLGRPPQPGIAHSLKRQHYDGDLSKHVLYLRMGARRACVLDTDNLRGKGYLMQGRKRFLVKVNIESESNSRLS